MNNAETKKIIFEGKGRTEIFHFQPENVDKEKHGVLYFVGQTGESRYGDVSYYLLNSLAATLKREYYGSTLQHAQAFESALKKANEALAPLSHETKEVVELVALIMRKNQIHFSLIGGCEVFLIRDEQLFQLYQQKTSASKPYFTSIIKGKVKGGDRIIVATSRIKTLFEKQTFLPRLIHRSFDRLEDYLKKESPGLKNDAKGLALLLIELRTDPEVATPPPETESFDEVLATSEARASKDSGSASSQLTFPLKNERRQWFYFVRNKLVYFLASVLTKKWNALKVYFALRHPSYNRGRPRTAKIQEARKENVHRSLSMSPLRGLSMGRTFALSLFKQRILYFFTIVITVIIIAMLLLLFLPKNRKTTVIQNNNASLALLSLPSQEKMLSFETISSPLKEGIMGKEDALLFSAQNVLEANLISKNIEPFLNLSPPLARGLNNEIPSFLVKEANKLYLYSYDPKNKALNKEILVWPLRGAFLKDIAFYGGNTYLLEGAEKQIIKYEKNNFLRPSQWLSVKSQQELKNPLSLAADGSLYVLDAGEKIIEFRLGQKKRELPITEVSLQTKIKTNGSLSHLYLIDPATNHIMLIDKKTGKIMKDHTFSSLEPILDIYPDEVKQHILILTKNSIVKVKL